MAEFLVLTQRKKNTTGSTIKQGFAVKLSADGGIAPCAADTDVLYGVALEDIRDGDSGNIGVIGTYRCLAGDAVTSGQRVGPDANGRFIAVTEDQKTVAGVAEQSAARNALFEVSLGVGITSSVTPAMIRKRRR